ncbi:MAG: SEC-C domain-containing protein [Xanthobacteraceae bacterium]
MAKIGRNEPCPCGSGLKYKKCHGSYGGSPVEAAGKAVPNLQHVAEQMRARERIRQTQQGLGRPIVGLKSGGRQIVAVGNKVYFSDKWKTFPDFLADYMKQKLGSDWGNAEIAKPFAERNPLMQWYDAYCKYQQATIATPGEVCNANVSGVVACYLGLAYSLYLLDHNVEIQDRLIARLRDPRNFQGAFYELFVANILIRAGFQLTLEDESDGKSKHCEFATVSRETGRKYSVEAKMGSSAGVLGKTRLDGGSGRKALGRLIPNLNNALAKPAVGERLIFIDLNVDPKFDHNNKPTWSDAAVERIDRYEATELPKGVSAYLFLTNIGFHRNLDGTPAPAMLPFGLGIPDFNRPGYMRLSAIYRQKRKHIDAHHIGESFLNYTKFPTTFDGSLPSEAFGGASSRVKIGESYLFQNVGGVDMVGTVTYATVWESEKRAAISVTFTDGTSRIITQPMANAEFTDFKAHPDAYFGRILPVNRRVENQYELFEFFIEANRGLSRAILLQCLHKLADFDPLGIVSDEDLLAEYCEALVAAVPDPAKKSA